MKQLKNLMLCSVAFLAMTISGCGNNGGGQGNSDDSRPIVFVMSGQSNMEGQTDVGRNGDTSYLDAALQSLGITDGGVCKTGIDSVLTSYYGNGYGELDRNNYNRSDVHASNTTDKIKGAFFPTKMGMGHSDTQIGPELGCAYVLKDHATADQPIYLVKMASSGSGFAQSGDNAVGKNWEVKTESGEAVEHNLFSDFLKPFLKNNLDWIEETTGKKPLIKGWLWHQGESDGGEQVKRDAYARRLSDLIAAFRTEFADYSTQGDDEGKNIAFIDGMIYEGSTMLIRNADDAKALNQIKLNAADKNDNRYIVDTYANEDPEQSSSLTVSGDGSTSGVHYNTKDSFRLGMAYGRIIVDNLLD